MITYLLFTSCVRVHAVVICIILNRLDVSSDLNTIVDLVEAGKEILRALECDILDRYIHLNQVVLVKPEIRSVLLPCVEIFCEILVHLIYWTFSLLE